MNIKNMDDCNCSDDGGETYELSSSTFPRADESSLAFVGEEELVVNLRRDVEVMMMMMTIMKMCMMRMCVCMMIMEMGLVKSCFCRRGRACCQS